MTLIVRPLHKRNYMDIYFLIGSFLDSTSHETFVEYNRSFWMGAIVESVSRIMNTISLSPGSSRHSNNNSAKFHQEAENSSSTRLWFLPFLTLNFVMGSFIDIFVLVKMFVFALVHHYATVPLRCCIICVPFYHKTSPYKTWGERFEYLTVR